MLNARRKIQVPLDEVQFSAVRAQGAGGQNVNKVSSAIHLRFNIPASSLPEKIKQRLLQLSDRRVSSDGTVVIKAQNFRTQEKNREDALSRLQQLIEQAAEIPKRRIPTKPSRGAKERRLQSKNRRSQVKTMRGKVKE
ncbi:alternative ribosome rescue aminoacyl-tRNA hydrolase ArfB [Microbulbifer sp. GL-2]|uniref:alternative ribosome rescue aminoacyl-tRNA hydrolase ArfB n=1 Tax=Microbulbifer sp. GL-2 TaxID=2591606 RepID=UPI0011659C58|nr:alternative ribosome rescue aminoacyl-tRNA hydrolase ArfB [Microbulbifer sp. GL-2]BBM02158.1 peptidyl-tRNA hydrolase [Microbulbifer sp. GL-2]